MALVKAQCTNCGGKIEVNSEAERLICKYCGMEFVVQDAINTYNTNIVNNNTYNIEHANIKMDSFNEQEELKKARKMVELNDYENAEKKYNFIYLHNPDNMEAMFLKNISSLLNKYSIIDLWNLIQNLYKGRKDQIEFSKILFYIYKDNFIDAFLNSQIVIDSNYLLENLTKENLTTLYYLLIKKILYYPNEHQKFDNFLSKGRYLIDENLFTNKVLDDFNKTMNDLDKKRHKWSFHYGYIKDEYVRIERSSLYIDKNFILKKYKCFLDDYYYYFNKEILVLTKFLSKYNLVNEKIKNEINSINSDFEKVKQKYTSVINKNQKKDLIFRGIFITSLIIFFIVILIILYTDKYIII